MSTEFNWQEKYSDKISIASKAMELINSGDTVFIGTGCAAPQYLIESMVKQSRNFYDVHIVHLLTKGEAPYATEAYRDKFKLNSLFIDSNVRDAIDHLVRQRVDAGQLDDAPLTMAQLTRVREEFLRVFEGARHNRIDYPKETGGLSAGWDATSDA